MSQPNTSRKLLPELVIAIAVFYGLWSLLVSPMRASLNEAKANHSKAIEHTRISGNPELATPRLHMVMDSIDGMMQDIERRSGIAQDPTRLQARLMEIGEESGIRIERVNPAKTRPLALGDQDDTVASFEIDCSGQYHAVVGFVAAIEEQVGLTAVERFSIRPDTSGSGTAVKARFRTLHYSFDTKADLVLGEEQPIVGGH